MAVFDFDINSCRFGFKEDETTNLFIGEWRFQFYDLHTWYEDGGGV